MISDIEREVEECVGRYITVDTRVSKVVRSEEGEEKMQNCLSKKVGRRNLEENLNKQFMERLMIDSNTLHGAKEK